LPFLCKIYEIEIKLLNRKISLDSAKSDGFKKQEIKLLLRVLLFSLLSFVKEPSFLAFLWEE